MPQGTQTTQATRPPRQPRYNPLMFRDAPAALALASAIGTIAIGCGKTGPPAETDRPVTTTSAQERDIHSYARPEDVRVTHVALDLDADFDARVLSGTATLTLHRNASANQVVLDTKGLEIQGISGGGSDLK